MPFCTRSKSEQRSNDVRIGFDNQKYLAEQKAAIVERMERFSSKLYIEFGGKLLYDYHAARVLPGFSPNVKIRLIEEFRDRADVILCIYSGDIERRKIRADFGITYDQNALKTIDELADHGREMGFGFVTAGPLVRTSYKAAEAYARHALAR